MGPASKQIRFTAKPGDFVAPDPVTSQEAIDDLALYFRELTSTVDRMTGTFTLGAFVNVPLLKQDGGALLTAQLNAPGVGGLVYLVEFNCTQEWDGAAGNLNVRYDLRKDGVVIASVAANTSASAPIVPVHIRERVTGSNGISNYDVRLTTSGVVGAKIQAALYSGNILAESMRH